MGQIEDIIIYDIAQQWLPITFDAIRSALRKHLEPQQEDKKIEPLKQKQDNHWIRYEWNIWNICDKINEIILYLNNQTNE